MPFPQANSFAGIDSLIAVEIRNWFLKELNVDVPVLKVIGGASIVDIVVDVLGKMSLQYTGAESAKEKQPEVAVTITLDEPKAAMGESARDTAQGSSGDSDWEKLSGGTRTPSA